MWMVSNYAEYVSQFLLIKFSLDTSQLYQISFGLNFSSFYFTSNLIDSFQYQYNLNCNLFIFIIVSDDVDLFSVIILMQYISIVNVIKLILELVVVLSRHLLYLNFILLFSFALL